MNLKYFWRPVAVSLLGFVISWAVITVLSPSWKSGVFWFSLAASLIILCIWFWDKSASQRWYTKLGLSLLVIILGGSASLFIALAVIFDLGHPNPVGKTETAPPPPPSTSLSLSQIPPTAVTSQIPPVVKKIANWWEMPQDFGSCDPKKRVSDVLVSLSEVQLKCDPETKKWVVDYETMIRLLEQRELVEKRLSYLAFALQSRVLSNKEMKEVAELGTRLFKREAVGVQYTELEMQQRLNEALLQQYRLRTLHTESENGK